MNYIENNKLIAEFMGLKTIKESDVLDWGKLNVNSDSISENQRYHKSFDWLMPVVEKINKFHVSIRPFKYGNPELVKLKILENKVTIEGSFWINPNTINGNYWVNLKKKSFKYDKNLIDAIYLAVIEFIKWYNEHNK